MSRDRFSWRDLKWFKQVGLPESVEWAYWDVQKGNDFPLHWHRKGKGYAAKPSVGDVIVLKQKGRLTHLVAPYTSRVWKDPATSHTRWPLARDVICMVRLEKEIAPEANRIFFASLQGGAHGNGVSLASYAKARGISLEDQQRAIWRAFFHDDDPFNLPHAGFDEEGMENGYIEGREIVSAIHSYRERNPQVIREVKRQALHKDPFLRCEVCGFSFQNRYGDHGRDFIEAHHRVPISELNSERRTTICDIALLCSNCHRMIHRKRPWLTVEQLKQNLQS